MATAYPIGGQHVLSLLILVVDVPLKEVPLLAEETSWSWLDNTCLLGDTEGDRH